MKSKAKRILGSLRAEIRDDVRLFFAPLRGAINAVREEINRPQHHRVAHAAIRHVDKRR